MYRIGSSLCSFTIGAVSDLTLLILRFFLMTRYRNLFPSFNELFIHCGSSSQISSSIRLFCPNAGRIQRSLWSDRRRHRLQSSIFIRRSTVCSKRCTRYRTVLPRPFFENNQRGSHGIRTPDISRCRYRLW